MQAKCSGSPCWLPAAIGGPGGKTWVFSGPEGIYASRAEDQCLKDVGEGDHAQEMLSLVHEHQPVHLQVHSECLGKAQS